LTPPPTHTHDVLPPPALIATAAAAAAAAAAADYDYAFSNLNMAPFPGPLPPSWGDLLEPTEFDLQYNFATGTLPENWSKLTKLKVL
jgi:hypothetical protein